MTIIKNPWLNPNASARVDIVTLSTEPERWAAILEEPLGLTRSPLMYGPLTVEGYLKARADRDLSKHPNWPQDPITIAKLLVTCGVDRYDAPYAALDHGAMLHSADSSGAAKLLGIHLAILHELDIEPSLEELVYCMEYADWGDAYFEDFMKLFDVMKEYLPTAEAESVFLETYLPKLSASKLATNAQESVGLALAASFTRNPGGSISEWCKNNDDSAGLAYLVFQGRFSFAAWLFELASPTAQPRRRGYRPDANEDTKLRREEQLELLHLLSERLPQEVLAEQGASFRDHYPEMVEDIIHGPSSIDSVDSQLRWAMRLFEARVIPQEYPILKDWFEQANSEHQDVINSLVEYPTALFQKIEQVETHKMHYICGPIAAGMSDEAKTILARDIVFRSHPDQVASYISRMPDKAWLQDVSVAPLILARANGGMGNSAYMLTAFYPFMPRTEQREVAVRLLRQAFDATLSIDRVTSNISAIEPVNYACVSRSFHKGLPLMLHMLTRANPDTFVTSMEALDVKDSDPLYLEMAEQWMAAKFTEQAVEITMPVDMGEAVYSLG